MRLSRSKIVLAIVGLLLTVSAARSQTRLSYRIEAMGGDLQGIVPDFLTDALLNPAATGGLERPQVYLLRLSGRGVSAPYHYVGYVNFGRIPLETYGVNYSVTPIGGSYFGTVGSLAFSVSTEIGYRGDDNTRENEVVFLGSSASATAETYNNRSINDTHFYLVDAVLATTGDEVRWGLRVQGRYTANDDQYATFSEDESWFLADPTRRGRATEGNADARNFRRTSVSAALGLERPGRLFEDVVIGGSVRSDRMDAGAGDLRYDDEDIDGDGKDIFGGRADYYARDAYFNSERDYSGFGGFARVHNYFGGGARSTLFAAWTRLDGDGVGQMGWSEQQFPIPQFREELVAAYEQSGRVDDVSVGASVGYSGDVIDALLIGAGLRATYTRTKFDEEAAGDGTLIWEGDVPIEGIFPFGLEQGAHYVYDTVDVRLPIGLEWSVWKYIRLRAGLTWYAQRTKSEELATRYVTDARVQGSEALDQTRNFESGRSTRTGYTLTNGIGLSFNERLMIDLLTTSGINLASYAYVSAGYRF